MTCEIQDLGLSSFFVGQRANNNTIESIVHYKQRFSFKSEHVARVAMHLKKVRSVVIILA